MKRRILVVDDQLAMRELLKFRLVKRGYDVVTAKDEREFWNSALDVRPDLIILDVLLDNRLGTEIYDSFLNFGLDPNIPVIFITALVEKQSPKRIKSGAKYALFSKPFDFDKLMRTATKFLNESKDSITEDGRKYAKGGHRR